MEIRACTPGTPDPATRLPFPNVPSWYLFPANVSGLFHTLRAVLQRAADARAARCLPIPATPDSARPALATLQCAQACFAQRRHTPQHPATRQSPRCPAQSRSLGEIHSSLRSKFFTNELLRDSS